MNDPIKLPSVPSSNDNDDTNDHYESLGEYNDALYLATSEMADRIAHRIRKNTLVTVLGTVTYFVIVTVCLFGSYHRDHFVGTNDSFDNTTGSFQQQQQQQQQLSSTTSVNFPGANVLMNSIDYYKTMIIVMVLLCISIFAVLSNQRYNATNRLEDRLDNVQFIQALAHGRYRPTEEETKFLVSSVLYNKLEE